MRSWRRATRTPSQTEKLSPSKRWSRDGSTDEGEISVAIVRNTAVSGLGYASV